MELRKTNERWDRQFDANGNVTERLESTQFDLLDKDGNNVGNASVNQGYGNANISLSGFNTVDEGIAKLHALLGIEPEENAEPED